MRHYVFTELGYFTPAEVAALKKIMDSKTFMKFEVSSGGIGVNQTLVIQSDYDNCKLEDMKNFFLSAALTELARKQEGSDKA